MLNLAFLAAISLGKQSLLNAQDFGLIRYCNYQLTATPTKIEDVPNFSTKWLVSTSNNARAVTVRIPEQYSREDFSDQRRPNALKSSADCAKLADELLENIKVPFPKGRIERRDVENSKSPNFTVAVTSIYDNVPCTHHRYSVTVSKRTGSIELIYIDMQYVPTKEVESYTKAELLKQALSKSPSAKLSKEWIEWGFQQPRSHAEAKLPSGPMVKLYYLEVLESNGKPRVFTFRMNGALVGDSADIWWIREG